MARDYAKKPRTKTTPAAQRRTVSRKPAAGNSPGAPGWAWALAGLALGLFVAFLVYLNENRPATPAPAAAKTKPTAPGAGNTEQRPRFDFYTILPEQEVVVPEGAGEDERAAAPEQEKAQYLLQAGSFRTLEQADSLRARLALLGVEASIETVRLKEGDTWHRVRIGPYTNVREVAKIQEHLRRQEIQTLRVKIR